MSSTSKRERQKAGHRARLQAERAAQERYRRRRRLSMIALVLLAVFAVGVLGTVLIRSNDDSTALSTTDTTTADSSTTSSAPLESAAGKPCVALADPLPTGAPEVPMPVGEIPSTELVSQDLVAGSGTPAQLDDQITVNYIGVSCSTGKIFDSSWTRGKPVSFALTEGQLIPGWTQGIPGMMPGGQRLLVVPADLAYGATGNASASIAPDETLVFVVELESAGPATTTTAAP